MASLIRSAKSASNWTKGDLDAYNIRVVPQDTATFFGKAINNLPEPSVSDEILNIQEAGDMTNEEDAKFICLLDDTMMSPSRANESSVDDFAIKLFDHIGYLSRDRRAHSRQDLPLLVCGEIRHAKTDVCITNGLSGNIILLVQEDKRYGEHHLMKDIEAQLIAEAIGAFTHNNNIRRTRGLPELPDGIIPGIVMIGTMPTFYKIPVTSNLVCSVHLGQFPNQRTDVFVCHVPTPRQHRRWSEGMKPLENRHIILRCYEAFKEIVGIGT